VNEATNGAETTVKSQTVDDGVLLGFSVSEKPTIPTKQSDPTNDKPSVAEVSSKILTAIGHATSTFPDTIPIPHLPRAQIVPVSKADIQSIRNLTTTTLQVRYSDSFFKEPLSDPVISTLTRVVLYDSKTVGWIRCRLEACSPNASQPVPKQIYIQALALLAPYRGNGLATALLDAVLATEIAKDKDTISVYAHVWEKNEDGLEWYAKRGFKRVLLVERYYRRLNPGGAWIVRKQLDQ
jgi:ribosomal protein S18 acetylase RimI-like enzyme